MVAQNSAPENNIIFPGIKRSISVIKRNIRVAVHFIGGNINGCAKSTGSIGGTAHSSLNLNAAGRGGNIRQVYKKSPQAFRIIIRDAIKRNIYPCCIRSTNTYPGISNAISGI